MKHGRTGVVLISFLGLLAASEGGRAADGQDAPLAATGLRISRMGPDGQDYGWGAFSPSVAYNPNANEYLIVWCGAHTTKYEHEIYGQRIDAATGMEVGPDDFRISDMGTDGDETRDAAAPVVVYNATANEYLVVWQGDDNPNWDDDVEIFGQRLSATGAEIGADVQITVTGPSEPIVVPCGTYTAVTCEPSKWSASQPAVAYSANSNEYLVAYQSSVPATGNYARQTYVNVTRLNGTATPIGSVVVASGFMSADWVDGRPVGRAVSRPAIALNPASDDLLVVWERMDASNDPPGTGVAADMALLDAAGATSIVRDTIDSMGRSPTAVYNPIRNEFLVVWMRGPYPWIGYDVGVYGQRLSASGARTGSRIAIDSGDRRVAPRVACNPSTGDYHAAWWLLSGIHDVASILNGRRVSGDGGVTDPTFVIASGQFVYDERDIGPALIYGSRPRRYFTVWASSLLVAPGEIEIYGSADPAGRDKFTIGLGNGGSGEFQIWSAGAANATPQATRQLPWPTYNNVNGELHPAMGDVDGDGFDEIVMGLGSGSNGWMAVFDDAEHGHALLRWVQLPWRSYNTTNGTIWPAVGDIDGDGRAEIVAGLGAGGAGWYAIFDDASSGYALVSWRRVNWSWYNATQTGETRPAVANIDGGSFSEIVIGLGPGSGGWMELVDDAEAGFAHLRWLRVGWSAYVSGSGETYPAAGDVDGDGYDEIVVGLGANSNGWLQVIDDAFTGLAHKAWLRVNWQAYASAAGETHPAVGDIDGDGVAEVVVALGVYPGDGGWFEMRDDASSAFASLGWRNAGRAHLRTSGGATFAAAARVR